MQPTTILLLGAGKSASVLIDYLKNLTRSHDCQIIFADANLNMLLQKVQPSSNIGVITLDILNDEERKSTIQKADIVISLLPPHLHYLVAVDCLAEKKHLLTASYVDEKMKALAPEIKAAGILFLCEMGLDPGIDHMSAMQLIDEIHKKGGHITNFKSHCGGLISPESDTNSWHYKISWNPRNIVLAGKDGAVYKQNDTAVTIPYPEQFYNCPTVHFKNFGEYAYYANRNSLPYIEVYGLQQATHFLRTTLRHKKFCMGWYNLVTQLGLTDTETVYTEKGITVPAFVALHKINMDIDDELKLTDELTAMFNEIGINDDAMLIDKTSFTAADVLQQLIETKWLLQPTDKDLVLMMHEIEYTHHKQQYYVQSSLAVKGKNDLHSAMATTVGLPLGIAATLLLENKLPVRGLHIPTIESIYTPVLEALKKYDIVFEETKTIMGTE